MVVVVGSGVVGFIVVYILFGWDWVILYEVDGWLGGYVYIYYLDNGGGFWGIDVVGVDLVFLVYNDWIYLMLCWLFVELGVVI